VSADPQFVGLQGQQFQVHGMPDEFFNLITSPDMQLNSRFTYLASGQCSYNNTECWTHPGTYVDQLGFMFNGINVKLVAGPHHKGLRGWINDAEIHTHQRIVLNPTNSTDEIVLSHPHHDTVTVSTPLFTIEITNSDWFFNFNLVCHATDILRSGRFMHFIGNSRPHEGVTVHGTKYPSYQLHGLVGQTWKNARYPAKRFYEGEVDDYMMLDHQLFSSDSSFNLFKH